MRGLWITAITFLIIGVLLLVGGLAAPDLFLWFDAHGAAMLVGGALIAIEALHYTTLERFRGRTVSKDRAVTLTSLYAIGASFVTLGWLIQPSGVFAILALFGWAVLVGASVVSLSATMDLLPKRGESVVDVEKDPLTKGDDASWKHVRFAHFFLPVGLLLVAVPFFPLLSNVAWAQGLHIGGIHILGIGYGLLSMYGLGHLWVPRFSGVPAIAAGAIKGELHSTLPAMILLPIGFALDIRGLIIAGGAFAFLGFFTYMGVLGANIMRNKSPTHRVTPEFVYIPWTFTGIFWLVSGVLMGIFLNVVPELLAGVAGGLSSVHVHINIFGGILQLIMGWLTRIVPKDEEPPRFTGAMTASYYAFNAAVVAVLFYTVGGNPVAAGFAIVMLLAAFALFGRAMQAFFRPSLSLGA